MRKKWHSGDMDDHDEEALAKFVATQNERLKKLNKLLRPDEVYFFRLGVVMSKVAATEDRVNTAIKLLKKIANDSDAEKYRARFAEHEQAVEKNKHQAAVLSSICSAIMTVKTLVEVNLRNGPGVAQALDFVDGDCDCDGCKLGKIVREFCQENYELLKKPWSEGWDQTEMHDKLEALIDGRDNDDQ